MAACPYGSIVAPGSPAYVWFGPSWLSSVLSSAFKLWALPLVLALDNRLIETAVLCAVDQPDPGGFPTSDVLLWLATGTFGAPSSAARLSTWLTTWGRAYMWSQYCRCSTATPGCVSTATGTDTNTAPAGTTETQITRNFSVTPGVSCTFDWSASWGGGGAINFSIRETDAGGTINYSYGLTVPVWSGFSPISHYGFTFTPHSTSDHAMVQASFPSGGARAVTSTTIVTNACPSPTTQPAPAEPSRPTGLPDAPAVAISACSDLVGPVEQLLQELQELQGQVHYLIGQRAPYSYMFGTPSSGLSGTGYVAVSECMGVLVTLTTIPSAKGRQSGTPTRYFDCGRINWGDVNGYHAHHPIHESPELILGIPDTATRVGYTFPSGVVATIMPVLRV